MKFTALQIATLINGHVEGDEQSTVSGFGKIEEAQQGELTFFANPKYEAFLYTTGASVIILNEDYLLTHGISATLIRVKDAYQAFATLLQVYNEQLNSSIAPTGIEQPSFIHESAKIGQNVYIGAFAYIGELAVIEDNVKIYPNVYIGKNVKIGAHSTLYPHVNVYHNCVIGRNVMIHSGVIVGSDGFGFAPQSDGSYKKVPQLGNVVIEDDVEVGSNTTIDRATIGSTVINKGVKLDNLIQIAHNVQIGNNTVIAAQSGISGSTKIGANCIVGGQVGIVGHIQLADRTKINAQSGVTKSVKKEGVALTGSPAFDYTAALRSQAIMKRLPQILERLEFLEEKIKNL